MGKINYNGRIISFGDPKQGETKEQWIARQKKAPAFTNRDDADKVLGEQYDKITAAPAPEQPAETPAPEKKVKDKKTKPDTGNAGGQGEETPQQ